MQKNVILLTFSLAVGYAAFLFLSLPTHAFSGLDLTTQLARSASLLADPEKVLGAGIAFGLAALGGGVAVGYAGSAAIAAIAEKPNLFGRALLFVVLGEGIAIYGFVIVFILTTA